MGNPFETVLWHAKLKKKKTKKVLKNGNFPSCCGEFILD